MHRRRRPALTLPSSRPHACMHPSTHSRQSAAGLQLKRRVQLVFVRDVRSVPVITAPSLIFTTFLDTIHLHLTPVEDMFRVFPARGGNHRTGNRARNAVPDRVRQGGSCQHWQSYWTYSVRSSRLQRQTNEIDSPVISFHDIPMETMYSA